MAQLDIVFGLQKVIHIPISTMNSVLLGRIRRFHVLDSHDRRGDAGGFIW
jgi:hypothetical protein